MKFILKLVSVLASLFISGLIVFVIYSLILWQFDPFSWHRTTQLLYIAFTLKGTEIFLKFFENF
jgi:hypothetical protein